MKNELTLNQEEIMLLAAKSPEVAIKMADKAFSYVSESKQLNAVVNFLVWHGKTGGDLEGAIERLQAKAKEGKK